MKKINIYDVADYFLSCVDYEAGSLMTHLKLQKLCYYAQAWSLVFDNEPLFNEAFEAWMHGPASPDLWQVYRDYGWQPIPPNEEFDSSVFTKGQIETLDAVWEAYGQYDGKYLEDLTHQEDPWIMARSGCGSGDKCNTEISLESIKEYYTKIND